ISAIQVNHCRKFSRSSKECSSAWSGKPLLFASWQQSAAGVGGAAIAGLPGARAHPPRIIDKQRSPPSATSPLGAPAAILSWPFREADSTGRRHLGSVILSRRIGFPDFILAAPACRPRALRLTQSPSDGMSPSAERADAL